MNFFKINTNRYSGTHIVSKIVMMGVLLSLSLVIHYITKWFEWPMATFLQFDFSLIPIIIALFIFDFWLASFLLIIRLSFQLIMDMDKPVFWYGPLIQLQIALVGLLTITILYSLLGKAIKQEAYKLLIILAIATIVQTLYATITNWLWSSALYFKLNGWYNGSINVHDYNVFYIKTLSKAPEIPTGGFPNWHIAVWAIFIPFNLIKFSTVSILSFPIIKFSYGYFTGKNMKFKK